MPILVPHVVLMAKLVLVLVHQLSFVVDVLKLANVVVYVVVVFVLAVGWAVELLVVVVVAVVVFQPNDPVHPQHPSHRWVLGADLHCRSAALVVELHWLVVLVLGELDG